MKKKVTYSSFDGADYLDNEEVIAEYLSAAAQDDNSDVLLKALSDVAKARGMAQVAKDAGLGRESLYKALAPGAKPRFETIASVMKALNVKIEVVGR
jgi:probable addiction module antidote protein